MQTPPPARRSPDGAPAARSLVAIDFAGAGPGDRVLVVDEGSSARTLVRDEKAPVKGAIVGVVDFVEREGEVLYASEERK
jgi:microcompartment protein CcmK/EutM